MALYKVKKGLDLAITGRPRQDIGVARQITRVAVVADDFPGMKPRMAVQEGDHVSRGQLLFEDRKTPGVRFTAPGEGRVVKIHRGARRVLQSVVIALSDAEVEGDVDNVGYATFESYSPNGSVDTPQGNGDSKGDGSVALSREQVVALLVESGLWTALRTRPFSKTPSPDTTPFAIFVNAMDTNALAPDPEVIIRPRQEAFKKGLRLLSKLTDGDTFLCVKAKSEMGEWAPENVRVEYFSGPHPAGTSGYHIHTLAPVNRERVVWTIGYQDVLSVAALFETGRLDVARVVSLAGPPIKEPRLIRTRVGASTDQLVGDEADIPECRLISGPVLSGKKAVGETFGYLGRYHYQLSVLKEGREREFLGWLMPGMNMFSITGVFLSKFFAPKKQYDFTTTTNGSIRAMVPIGLYERVMPMDIMPTFLLRALSVGDLEEAEKLGALELDEEDLGLCTFVCPGKTNYGRLLRLNLDLIEKEG